jgi:hypothetical protein
MDLTGAFIWGLAATLVLSTLLRGAQVVGFTRIDIPFMLGTAFTPDREHAKVYGYALHLLNGWIFALFYVALFQTAGQAGILFGALIGAAHAAFVLIVALPVLPAFHPRMASEGWGPEPTQQLEPPGNLGLNYGLTTPIATLAAHVVYGAILGHFCSLSY